MKQEKRLLITGFEPFGGENINPSWEAVAALPDIIGDYKLIKLQIPTEFDHAACCVLDKAVSVIPDVILCIGQAGGRSDVTPEAVAINLREASIPDNAGNKPVNVPVIAGEREAYFTTVPIRQMTEAIRACDIPGSLSYSAGTFVCNDVLYTLLHHYYETRTHIGFIHVPFLPEQARNNEPSLPLEQIVQALTAAITAL